MVDSGVIPPGDPLEIWRAKNFALRRGRQGASRTLRAILPVAEQLDRARRELDVDNPLNSRIALILIDNAMELIGHRKASDVLEQDRNDRKLTPRQRADARGRVFDTKIAFLRDQGHIPADQVRAISIFHAYRNQLYHVGLRDDPIIGALARRYLQLTLGLLVPLLGARRFLRWEPALVNEASTRLLPELAIGRKYSCPVDLAALAERLAPGPAPTELAPTLRDQVLALIDRSESDFAFIAKGRLGADDPVKTLVRIQLEEDTVTRVIQVRREQDKRRKAMGRPANPVDEVRLGMARGHPMLVELNAKVIPGWKPRHKKPPFASWRKRARTLGANADDLLALDAFDRLRREMDYLDEVMAEPIYDMHGWHEHQEDMAMDRR